MKKRNIIFAVVAVVAILVFAFVMQEDSVEKDGLWKNATYLQNTELGNGEKTLYVKVIAQEQSITFTIHTDGKTVGDALKEHKLVDGEESATGLYVKFVNGMEADYDKDQTYWAFNKDGESMLTGIDGAEFTDGDSFELVYTK